MITAFSYCGGECRLFLQVYGGYGDMVTEAEVNRALLWRAGVRRAEINGARLPGARRLTANPPHTNTIFHIKIMKVFIVAK